MTEMERKALRKIIADGANIAIPATSYDENLKPTEITAYADRQRWFESEDFRKGWELCHRNMTMYLKTILLTGTKEDIKRYAR